MTVVWFTVEGVPVRSGPGSRPSPGWRAKRQRQDGFQLSLKWRWGGLPQPECPCVSGLGPGLRRDDGEETTSRWVPAFAGM